MKRKAGESLTEVPVSAKRRNNLSDNSDEELRLFKHAESNRMHYHKIILALKMMSKDKQDSLK